MTGKYLFAALLAAALAGQAAAQTVNINCGGGAMTTSDGTQWVADTDFSGGDLLYTGYSIANTQPQDFYLYRSARAGLYGDFSYNIPVPNGSYTVTLRFAEIQYSGQGQRVFNVVLNGSTVLSNFDILAHAAPLTPVIEQFPVTVSNGAVQIAVNGVVNRGLLSAIQIAPAPGAGTGAPPAAPVLSVGAKALSFAATSGGSNPAAQSVAIANSGSGTMAWTAAATPSWLAVSPASGSGNGSISIQPNISGLAAGTYTGTVTVSAAGAAGSPATVAVTVTVGPAAPPAPATQPAISINCGGSAMTTADGTQWAADEYYSGGDLLYTGYAIPGANPQDYYLYRSARAGLYGDFSYSIPVANGSYNVSLIFAEIQYAASGQRLFNVAINGNTVLSRFDILAHTTPLTPLVEQFPVTVTNGTLQINVTGVVNKGILNAIQVVPASGQPAAPSLSMSGTGLTFTGTAGGSNPAAQTVNLGNNGGGTLSWTASSNQSWLTVSPASGTAPGTLSMQPNLNGLAAGTYSATVTVSAPGASNGSQTITVGLTVGAPAPSPALSVSTAALSFSGTAGSGNPASQTAAVSNSGGGTLSWTASSNQSWLSVSPASGTNSGTLTIGASLSGLTAGNYSGAITITGAGASKTIAVSLAVAAAPSPALSVSTTALSFSGTAGSSNPASQTVAVSNGGGGTLSWTASSNQSWLSVSPASGTNSGTLTIGASLSGLAAGNYSGAITVTGAGASKTIGVSFAVAPDPPPTQPPASTGTGWYVTTSGSPSGNGTMSSPWDLATALSGAGGRIKPGDTVWIRAGKYGAGQSNSSVSASLVGTASAPIIVRAYPGERVTIDEWLEVGCCDGAVNPSAGSYTWFWGLEFAAFNPNRATAASGPPGYGGGQNHNSVDIWAPGTKIIDCIVHDTGGGISVWSAGGTELTGNIVYNVGGYGPDRGHGHDFYVQNAVPNYVTLNDNIGFDSFDMGMHAYGSSSAYVQNLTFNGNVVFNSGQPDGSVADNLCIGGGGAAGGANGITLNSNYFYYPRSFTDGYNELGFLWDPGEGSAVVTNNFFIGGNNAIDLERWQNLTFQNNTIYSNSLESMLLLVNGDNPSTYQDSGNHYFGSGSFSVYNNCVGWSCGSGVGMNFATWQATEGLDRGSTFTPGAPTGVQTFVRPNAYEPGRANIIVFNWSMNGSVSVDLSSSGIKAGDRYQIRDAENWYNGPVVSGIYSGAPVTIPMTGLSIAQPNGSVPAPAVHTAPEFGVFVLLSGQALANTY